MEEKDEGETVEVCYVKAVSEAGQCFRPTKMDVGEQLRRKITAG